MKRRNYLILIALVLAVLVGCSGNASSGDRVVVAKFLYDSGLEPPQRYQVVVFKYPEQPVKERSPRDRADAKNPGQVATNYIKRLLGLPGELLAIFFGRIYHCDPQDAEPLRKAWAAKDQTANPLDLWQKKFMHIDDDAAVALFDAGKFKILRKSPATMLAMRRIVYDNDHQPRDLQNVLPPRWDVDAGTEAVVVGQPKRRAVLPKLAVEGGLWEPDTSTGFRHSGKDTGAITWIRYQHILRPDNWAQAREGGKKLEVDKKPQLIRDVVGYNSSEPGETPSSNWVGDLMLEFELTVDKAEGELWLDLARGVDRFRARWNLQSGDCTLLRLALKGDTTGVNVQLNEQSQEIGQAKTRVNKPGTYVIRFANFDDRLTVWVDRDLPFGDGAAYEAPKQPGPTANDLRPALIGSKGAAVKVRHLKLWRDTYYTRFVSGADAGGGDGPEYWSDPRRWQALREIKPATFYVQPGHYMCMGDNSPASSDSRSWGTVPERLMLGRALVVYWPFGRAGAIE